MNSSIEIDKTKYFLGYYYGIGKVLSLNITPQPGMYFVNGETNSVWVWNALSRIWIDTNRTDSGLKGMLTDEVDNSPADFVPSPQVGVKESYFYIAECEDVDSNPEATPRAITFTYFKNGNESVKITIKKTSVIALYWNGDYWETDAVPMGVNWSLFASKSSFDELKNRVSQFSVSTDETVNKFFKELYIYSTHNDFPIEELYLSTIARNKVISEGETYWGINFIRSTGDKPLYFISYENPENKDVLEAELYEDGFGYIAKMYAVVDWNAIEDGSLFSTGLNIPLNYWGDVKYSPYISSYITRSDAEESIKFIDSNNNSNVFKELYISSFENKIYQLQEGKNVNTYLEDIPADSVNLRIMSITRNKVSSATGQSYWNLVFYINTPLYETRDGKNYIIRDAEGNVQYTKDSNLFFTLSEEKNGVIDETLTLTNVLYEENGVEYKSFNYKLKLYVVIDWELMTQGTIINFYPRNVLQSAYDINSSPQIKEYIKEKESSLPIKIEAKATFNLTPENRIALYGASLCSDSYPWFKEWLERYTGAEVLNAGNPGWNAKQLASTDYYNKIKSLDADIIYVMFGGNDKGDNVGTFGAVSSQPLVEEIPLSEEWSNSEAGSKDYLFIQSLDYVLRKLKSEYYNVNNSIKGDKRFPYIVVGTFPSQHREGWQFTEYNNPQNWLNKRNAIVECANKNNLPCIDMFSELGIDWDKEPYYNQDFDYNTATGIPTLVNRGIYTLDGLHLNEWGFQRMANLLSGALLPSNSGVKEIKLNPSFNLNNYKTQGLYYLNGERISSNDNLPIMNMGNVSGQITILDANGCVTQYLKLTNAGGSEGKEYVRTFANGGWSRWSELKQTIYLGQTSDDNLKYIVDNGHYEGAILNLNDLAGGTNIFATYLQAFLDTIPNVGYDRLISGSLFSIDVLNNYAVVKEAESWGRIFERSVTQIAKVQMIHGAYVEVQRTKIGGAAWSNWKMINVL